MRNSVTPCQGASDKKEEIKGVEPSPSIMTGRGGNHLNTLTHDAYNPMNRNQDFSPDTPREMNLLHFSPETPQEMNNSDFPHDATTQGALE